MKKLLTIAAVVLAAVCVQAATTSWDWHIDGIYGIDDADSGDEGYVTGMVELVALGATQGSGAFDENGTASGTISGATDGAFAAGTPWQAKVTVNVGGTDYTQTFDFSIPSGLTGDVAQDASVFSALSADLTTQVVGTEGVLMTSAMEAGGWTAVPEPCSVALLALGLAALGLKRKVA